MLDWLVEVRRSIGACDRLASAAKHPSDIKTASPVAETSPDGNTDGDWLEVALA